MDQIESRTHSFIIRIWHEEDGRSTWRGYITHVPSGERRYLLELDDIITFITPRLKEMGVVVRQRGRLCRWMKRRQKRDKTQANTGEGQQDE